MTRVMFGPLRLDVPADYTFTTAVLQGPVRTTEGVRTASRPAQSPARVVTTAEVVGSDVTPEVYLARVQAALQAAGLLHRTDDASGREVILADGSTGHWVEQLVDDPSTGARHRQLQLVVVRGGVAYSAVASALDGAPFEQDRQRFRSILLSLEVS